MNLFNRKNLIYALFGVVSFLIMALVFSFGFYLGDKGTERIIITDPETTLFEEDFSIFWEAIDSLRNNFYRPDEMDEKAMIYGAIDGVMRSLGDPYTSFFSPEDAKIFEENVSGYFGGVGIEIGMRNGSLTIISPLRNTPAWEAGLLAGDIILKVDDTFTDSFNLDQAVKSIRGEIGQPVDLLIMRDGWEEPREFTILRDEIEVPTLDWEILGEEIGYIQLYSFNANAPSYFHQASYDLLRNDVKGLILDMRNNTGGFLEVANNLAGWFLDRGEVIVLERFSDGETREFLARGNGAWKDLPVVVLVNGGSASASEILAGALRDHLSTPLIGNTTFGKGTVQQLKTLSDGSTLKMSIAEWITPSGETISGEGLDPDHDIDLSEQDIEMGNDPQLDKALEIIIQMVNNQ